ncbi:MAG: response regulator transcription factor [Magnetococcales bacterium]|nr:response regulator transcription factor [Magnetococcales bacterium]
MTGQSKVKLNELDITFNCHPRRVRNILPWDEFSRLAPRTKSSREVFQLLVDCLVPLGAYNLVYAYHDEGQLVFHSILDQSWRVLYKQCGYHNLDPGIRHVWYGGTGPTAMGREFFRFGIDSLSDTTKRLLPAKTWSQSCRDFQEEVAYKTGFEIGFTIPLPPKNGMGKAGCSFGANMKGKEFDQLYNHHGGQIIGVLQTFHNCMQDALQYERRKEFGEPNSRELAALQMLANGIERKDIEVLVSLKTRSVQQLLETARDKLGVHRNNFLAIKRAKSLGWIE